MNKFFIFLFNSLLGGCLLLGVGLSILFSSVLGEQVGGTGFIIALGLYVILKQFKK